MLTVTVDAEKHIAILEPDGPLSEGDFKTASATVDAMIAKSGKLNGLVVHSKSFPGWDSFAAMVSHMRFVKNHHEKLSRVALATDSIAAHLAEVFATHFVMAEIKIFPYEDFDKAKQWVLEKPAT